MKLKSIFNQIHITTDNEDVQILAQYLDLWNDTEELKETLIEEVDSVLSGNVEYAYIGAEVVGVADIRKNTIELGQSEVGYPNMELPTLDFKALIMEWISILESQRR